MDGDKSRQVLSGYMDEAYGAMRPHQRGLFNLIGLGALGARNIGAAGANSFNTLGRILGYGDPVTMDEVAAGARDASMFAVPGQVGLRRDPVRAMDEATAARLESMPGKSALPGRAQVPPSQVTNPNDMGQFLQFATRKNEGGSTTATGLYDQYYNWLDRHGGNPMPLPQFNQAMRDQGLTGQRIAGQMRWIGVEPLPSDAIAARTPAPANMTTMPQYTPANTATRMSPEEMRRLMRVVE